MIFFLNWFYNEEKKSLLLPLAKTCLYNNAASINNTQLGWLQCNFTFNGNQEK